MLKHKMYTNSSMMIIFFVVVLAFMVGMSRCKAEKTTNVTITNMLDGKMDLKIHCKSKDDDLGVHVLPYTQPYSFTFKINFWGTTLFYCSFVWKNELHWFDIFDATRDKFCSEGLCSWNIVETGPCFVGFSKTTKCFDWYNDTMIISM